MWYHFLLENAHFAINLFAALAFFAVFWLYYDAWRTRREAKETIRLIGFCILCVSFIFQAVVVESTIVAVPMFAGVSLPFLATGMKILGLSVLLAALLADPLQDEPGGDKASIGIPLFLVGLPIPAVPILSSLVGLLYLRRATVGLEDHLKPLAFAFGGLAVSELLSLHRLFEGTTSVALYPYVSPFGPFWILSHGVLLGVAAYLCRWVFGYLLKQFQAQLFMVYTTTILVIFLVTTVSFTGLLLRNMETEALRQIETDVRVLDFALGRQKDGQIAHTVSESRDASLLTAVGASDRKTLGDIATRELVVKGFTSFLVVSDAGQVLARGEDRDRVGDSLSQDPLVKRGLLGEQVATIITRDGVIAPDISVFAIAPLRNDAKEIVGAIVTGRAIDTAFVDGMKKSTGLDASVYGDNIVSATTFATPDGASRLIGMREEHASVKQTVLADGKPFAGSISVRETLYTSAFLPLADVDGNPVGMLFVGRPQSAILSSAGQSIQYTFLITAFLIVIAIAPAYWIARYIAYQLE